MRWAIIDANESVDRQWQGSASSVVGGWLRWELQQVGMDPVDPATADAILLVYSGSLDWSRQTRTALTRAGVEPAARSRRGQPYVVAGGPCDSTPLTTLKIADAVVVGEAYRIVRAMLNTTTISGLVSLLRASDHAIERSQLSHLRRDPVRPWLLREIPQPLAAPDTWIDWEVPPVKSDDKVIRVVASKGCHLKCAFCATTYRQQYAVAPDGEKVVAQIRALKSDGHRVQMLSNDPLDVPFFRRVRDRLDSQSFTVMEMDDDENRAAVIRAGVGIARLGVEGLTEKIRLAFGKPITNERLIAVLGDLHRHRVNTHSFWIVGAPYEKAADWFDFRSFFERLAETVTWGIHRLKMTTFLQTPPAPLTRFLPGLAYDEEMTNVKRWISRNCASRHIIPIFGRRPATHVADTAEQLAVPVETIAEMCATGETIDLAPTVDDAMRMTHEIVRWPIAPHIRWRVAEVYAARLCR